MRFSDSAWARLAEDDQTDGEEFIDQGARRGERPRASWSQGRVDGELRLICDAEGCGREANTIHMLPWCVGTKRIEAACTDHGLGGYHFPVNWLDSQPEQLIGQLSHLATRPGNGVKLLLRWLRPEGSWREQRLDK